MRKWLIAIATASLILTACGHNTGGKTESTDNVSAVDTTLTAEPDEVADIAQPTPDEAMPERADELFDDFIFNYAQNERLQRRRTVFPLPFYNDSTALHIERDDWQHDRLFVDESAYTLLFDREEDLDLVGDTSLTSVRVEWVYLSEQRVKRYYFERKDGAWMLEAINLRRMEQGGADSFVSFYAHFATDSLYRLAHTANPLPIVTIDPDDEFDILETSIDAEQLSAFAPQLPIDRLSNIDYGQRNEDLSRAKIMKLTGIGNGVSSLFYFRRRHGEWELYKYEDTSI